MIKIAIIGASYLQLPLVLKAKEMGIETHCFAWEDEAVCKDVSDYFYPISIVEKEQILEVCQRICINGITSIASDIAVPTISYVAEQMKLTSNLYSDTLATTNKFEMREKFNKHNVLSPKYVIANNYSIDGFNFPLIVKPTDRSGSRGVSRIEKIEDLGNAVDRAKAISFKNQAIIEEYISGHEVSVETISWQGEHFILAITDKVTTNEPYFVELEHHQPSMLPKALQQKIKTETIKALSALNIMYGASHSEFKITNSGKVYIIEVGARMGGDFIGSDLVRLSTGYDFLKGVINVSLGCFETPIIHNEFCSGVYFLSKETTRILPIIQNAKEYSEIVDAKLTDNELHSALCSADRSGYIIYKSLKRFYL